MKITNLKDKHMSDKDYKNYQDCAFMGDCGICHCRTNMSEEYIPDDMPNCSSSCDYNPNCYYKQLQACQEQVTTKTDECEKVTSQIKVAIAGLQAHIRSLDVKKEHNKVALTVLGIMQRSIGQENDTQDNYCNPILQENTALKQQLDEVTAQRGTYWELYSIEGKQAVKDRKVLVEALEAVINSDDCFNCKDKDKECWQCDSEHERHSLEPITNIAKTALDKLNK